MENPTLITINDYHDVVGHHWIGTSEGTTFLDSLIKNHPLAVVEILEEGGWDALVSMVLKGEKAYHNVLKEDPTDLDTARELLYGEYAEDSELDREIEKWEEELFTLRKKRTHFHELDELLTPQEMAELSSEQQWGIRNEREKKIEVELDEKIVLAEMNLENYKQEKEESYPIKLDFFPNASERLTSIPADMISFDTF
ncbi:hypothetical protein [Xanthovirga aplysinae]|uniref:hypothetical protein n=1 Tax=Xanthovirga aplysinae TaxID=2529853 RepID=UPI0012BC5464|nr:hypothetical protein [Xanthovirga aplysinae]MTI30027.1 hypothetical protein [Xanthovirga aplysinae]